MVGKRARSGWGMVGLMLLMLLIGGGGRLQAQGRDRYSEREVWQLAQGSGYEYGLRDGRDDARLGSSFDHQRSRAWKDGRWGYRHEYRHGGAYRDGFRDGYRAGYRAGYRDLARRNDRRGDRGWGAGRGPIRIDDDEWNGRHNRRRW